MTATAGTVASTRRAADGGPTGAPAVAGPTGRELDELIRAHLPLVGHVVRDMASRLPAHVHRDDLTSAGMTALLSAARSFDPGRGIPFPGFATTRIRGAVLDELRSQDWASRSVRSRARHTDTVREELAQTLGRTPSATEVAQALGTSTTDLEATEQDVQRAVVLSLQGFTTTNADDVVTDPGPNPEDLIVRREQIGYLHHAIEALPERLRTVVTDYYLNERPMAEIAAELGVTDSRISQLRAEALTLLRDGLNHHLNPELVPATARPDGAVARRRASYYAHIAERSTMHARLARTRHDGLPANSAA